MLPFGTGTRSIARLALCLACVWAVAGAPLAPQGRGAPPRERSGAVAGGAGVNPNRYSLAPLPAEWPVYRRDTALTGYSPLTGAMTAAPRIAWRYDIGAWEGLVQVSTATGTRAVSARPGGVLAPDYLAKQSAAWGIAPPVFRYPDGRTLVMADGAYRRWAYLIPALKVPQMVEWRGEGEAGPLVLTSYEEGPDKPKEEWRSTAGYPEFHRPHVLCADVDADGKLEVVTGAYQALIVHNGETGERKWLFRYPHRSRGFVGVENIDDDPQLEICNVANFQLAVEMLDCRDGKLERRWWKEIELEILAHQRMVAELVDSITDLEGDGRKEVVFNFFNWNLDNQWHLTGYDAQTGEQVLDLPGVFCSGIRDIDGDKQPELMCRETHDMFFLGYGRLALLNVRRGKATERWSAPQGRWLQTDIRRMPAQRAVWMIAGGPRKIAVGDVDGDGRQDCFAALRRNGAGETLVSVGADADGQFRERWRVTGPPGAELEIRALNDVDGDGRTDVLLAWQATGRAPQVLSAHGTRVALLSWRRVAAEPPTPIAVDLEGRGRADVLVTTGAEELVALRAPRPGHREPKLLWRYPGRDDTMRSLRAADLDGDGRKEIVCLSADPEGHAEVTALRANGSPLWRHAFPGFHAKREIFRLGGRTYMWVGRFTDPGRCDVFISLMRGIMHSDEGHMLDGRTGRELWMQRVAQVTRPRPVAYGYAGSTVAAADVTGDGRDELIWEYPVNYCVADGRTGAMTYETDMVNTLLPAWAAYGTPVIADFNGDASPDVLYSSEYIYGTIASDASRAIWHGEPGDTTGALAGVGDPDGDGRPEVAGPGFKDGMRCYDAATGTVEWTLPMPGGRSSPVATCDIDADGRDELLFTIQRTLYAVGVADGKVAMEWQLELPAAAGMPIVADVDADSQAEILLTTEDGFLYCLDAPPP